MLISFLQIVRDYSSYCWINRRIKCSFASFVTVRFAHRLHSIILDRIQLDGQHKPPDLWDVTPFSLPPVYWRFRRTCYSCTRINDGGSRFLNNIYKFLPGYLDHTHENTNYYNQLRGICKSLAIWQKSPHLISMISCNDRTTLSNFMEC